MIEELHRAVSTITKPVTKARLQASANSPVHSQIEQSKIQLEQATLILRGVPLAAIAGAMNGVIALLVGWSMVNKTILGGWAGLIILIAVIRLGLWARVRAGRPTLAVMRRFKHQNMIMMMVNGALWGMLAPIFAVYGQLGHVFLPFILAGMTAAAIVSSGACWKCVLSFNIPALLPMAAAFFFWGGEGASMISVVILLYGIVTSVVAFQTSQMIMRAIVLRSKNNDLAEALEAKFDDKADAEKRFQALIECSRALTLIFSPEGKITYSSPASSAILGTDASDIIGTTTKYLVHEDDLAQFQAIGSQTLSVLGEVKDVSHICVRTASGGFVALSGRLTNMLYVPGVEGFVFTGAPLPQDVATRLHAAQ